MTDSNEYDQPIGTRMPDWRSALLPSAEVLPGRYCRLERLDSRRHADDLYRAHSAVPDDSAWTYLPVGPFATAREFEGWVSEAAASFERWHYAVTDLASQLPIGTLSLMRADPANGSIEVGWVVFAPALRRTPISTEAQYLLMRYVFDELGYRRYEWKCDSLNQPSRSAAHRLGFTYEGTFRQHIVYKGRNRDTAWFAITRDEWPRARDGFERWLDPANFDGGGRQRESLHTR